jgi:hypothetical protein
MPEFPSVEWFEAVRAVVNQDGRLRRLGTCDAVVGVKVLDKAFEVTFEAFDCVSVREVPPSDPAKADFYLEAPFETWREMLENIKEHGKPDRQYTLNTIDFVDPEGFAKSDDQSKKDKFYRYGETFQQFFNASAEIETVFASPQAV